MAKKGRQTIMDLGLQLERANTRDFNALKSPMNQERPSLPSGEALSKKDMLQQIREANELEKRIADDDR